MNAPVYRYDRHGRKTLIIAKIGMIRDTKAETELLKARQLAGNLTANERLMSSIFGEIK